MFLVWVERLLFDDATIFKIKSFKNRSKEYDQDKEGPGACISMALFL